MKKFISIFTCVFLCLTLLFLAGCGNNPTDTNSSNSDPASGNPGRPKGEALTEEELPFERYIYDTGFYSFNDNDFPTLEFGEGKSPYGEKSIHIIGDSISEGAQAKAIYNNGYPALLKNSLNKWYGTQNWGYVIPFNTNDNGDRELHTFSAETGGWMRETHSPNTPGFVRYTSADKAGSTALIETDRRKDSYDRHINGFYIYYSSGSTMGGFDITVNGQKVHSVAAGEELSNWARTEYIAIPSDVKDKLEIRIIKTDDKAVSINGIAYAEQDDGLFVHNFACSGMTLCEVENDLLREMCKANYVFLALGYNDVGKGDVETYTRKLEVVTKACEETGATLVCFDFMWPMGENSSWGQNIKSALFSAAQAAKGYYIDFTYFAKIDRDYTLADSAHPTPKGYKLVARKLCYFLGIPFTSDLG
ncbi:MAG: SGNH/GDSL hydrolase family protein [Clostridia bacterium]|nr:SGNH/GDSL hydrolase family protein [Clostridia bacterium]